MLNSVVALFNAGAAAAAGDYESIATVTVGSGGAANVEFTSIATDWTHLQIRCIARTDRASTSDALKVTFNSDTGANYAYHQLYGQGTSVISGGGSSASQIYADRMSAASATASIFGAAVIDILDYANTNKYKTLRSLGGVDLNGSGEMHLDSGLWQNTNAITSIKLVPNVGPNFVQYSHFALYGIKGA